MTSKNKGLCVYIGNLKLILDILELQMKNSLRGQLPFKLPEEDNLKKEFEKPWCRERPFGQIKKPPML